MKTPYSGSLSIQDLRILFCKNNFSLRDNISHSLFLICISFFSECIQQCIIFTDRRIIFNRIKKEFFRYNLLDILLISGIVKKQYGFLG